MTTPIVPSITDEELESLESLAGKATPGEWWIDSHGHSMVSHDDGTTHSIFQAMPLVNPAVRHPETGNLSHWPNDWDASYIATASPQNILGLIDRLRSAEKNAARYLWLRNRVGVDFAYGGFITYLPTCGYQRDEQDKAQTDQAIDNAMEQ